MDKLLKDLNIDEKYSKPIKKVRQYSKVKDNIPLLEDYNFMADLLMLPFTKEKYRYLLVMVDLATDEFDIEPIKEKKSEVILDAAQRMFKRKHISKPYASIKTDDGNEFKGVFAKYMYNESILHKAGLSGRHQQTSNVESLNRQLGRLFNGYMNSIENKTGKVYREWTDVVEKVRKDLNAYRKKETKKIDHVYDTPDLTKKNKFKVGDFVYRPLSLPRNTLNEQVSGESFRMGDNRLDYVPRQIKRIVYYAGKVTFRYILKSFPNVSYAEHELIKAEVEGDDELFEIKEILERKFFDGENHYKIWFYDEYKKDAGWYSRSDMIKSNPELIRTYDRKYKAPVKKKKKAKK